MHRNTAHPLTLVTLGLALGFCSVILCAAASNRQTDVMPTSRGELRLMPIYHGSVMLKFGCFRHQLLLPRPYLVLTKPLRLDIQCQRAASVKIGWKYLDD